MRQSASEKPPRDHLYSELATLRALNEELAEQARQYKGALAPPIAFPDCWLLTRCEARMLAALYANPRGLTLEALHIAYSNTPAPETDANIVHVAKAAIQRKTRRFGIKIDTIRGPILSYQLAPGSHDVITLALKAPSATVWATLDERKLTITRVARDPYEMPREVALFLPEQLAAQVRQTLEAR